MTVNHIAQQRAEWHQRTKPMWTNANSLADFVGDVIPQSHQAPKPERTCTCGTVLSIYNSMSLCFPCIAKQNADQLYTPPPTKDDLQNTERLAAALEAATALSQPFTSSDLARAMHIEPNAANAVLRRLVARGAVSSLGKAIPTGRPLTGRANWRAVLMWSTT